MLDTVKSRELVPDPYALVRRSGWSAVPSDVQVCCYELGPGGCSLQGLCSKQEKQMIVETESDLGARSK